MEKLKRRTLEQQLQTISDTRLQEMSFSVLSDSSGRPILDEDGFPAVVGGGYTEQLLENIFHLQRECWKKYNTNPQISTAINDNAGSVCGKGFSIASPYADVQKFLKEIIYDSRNRLYSNLKKFLIRSDIEGELFIAASLHYTDGFVELDFMHPQKLKEIFYHPTKTTLPLFYQFEITELEKGVLTKKLRNIPSIYCFEMQNLIPIMESHPEWAIDPSRAFRRDRRKFKKTGGYQTFIISWDKSLFTKRNVSQMRTTIEWTNHYENLKRYEIDHKKSSGAYLWTISFEDLKAFKYWMSLSDDDKAKTGIMQQKTPGGTILMPPGMKMEVKNPQLSSISEQDTDILHMITAGLNKPEDMITGQSNGTYGSVKASRGPESDRANNRKDDFELFLRYDFFRHIFSLKNVVNPEMELERTENVVIDFKEGEEVEGKESLFIWESMEITFPTSEVSDSESATKALLGVKHGSLIDTLGIPASVVAKKLGFENYRTLRLKHLTEKKKYPELVYVDSDSVDSSTESTLLEKSKTDNSGEDDAKKSSADS